jgi:peptidoglycan/xylan/chitin deacetylase (PgdA/CDA1 family)/folate-dependent phosphoribosylglycinamide formyltransferase PurN
MSRIAVFTTRLDYAVRKGIVALADALPEAEFLVVVHQPRRRISDLVRNQWRNMKRNGWRWIPYQLGDAFARATARMCRLANENANGLPGSRYSAQSIEEMKRVVLMRTPDIHEQSIVERIRRFAPDLGVSLAAPILAPAVFSIPRLGTLNLHKGKVPEYRGMPPAFWELWHGEKEIGCTVHVVEAGLDTGAIVSESKIEVCRYSTLRGLQLTLDELGVRLMSEAAAAMLEGNAKMVSQMPGGHTFRKPTIAQQEQLRARLAQPSRDGARTQVKDLVFRGYVRAICPVPRRLRAFRARQRIVVFLYHRVNDDMRDVLTIDLEKFDAQMALLAGKCRLVDILDVVTGRVERDTWRPIVAVTFDDGYRDNYEHAVPILLRHRVPAAFFVSTGKIDVDGAFDHDLRRIGHGLPTMTWRQLKKMRDAGFTIGSHSVTHLDCGRADLEQVRSELRQSKKTLAERLGEEAPIFAYPYGRQDNMTPEALALVRDEGYVGCLSAYGGRNGAEIDPFNVRRVPINGEISEWAFRARLEGWY